MNAINSSVNFGRAQAADAKKAPKQPRPKFSELGNRTMAEKYGNANLTTESAPIILTDYIRDHVLEFAATGIALFVAFANGKELMSGKTNAFVEAAKKVDTGDSKSISKLLNGVKSYANNVKVTLAATKKPEHVGLIDAFRQAGNMKDKYQNLQIDENSKLMKKVSGFLADKANENPNSFVGKFVNKLTSNVYPPVDKEAGVLANLQANATNVQDAFAKKYGVVNGCDLVDTAVAAVGAGASAAITNEVTDKVTDLNDDKVAERAEKANQEYYRKQAAKLANSMLNLL